MNRADAVHFAPHARRSAKKGQTTLTTHSHPHSFSHMLLLTLSVSLMLFLRAPMAAHGQTVAQDRPAFVEDSPKVLGEAYGYCIGQSLLLAAIERRFPSLAGQVKYARYQFDGAFSKSIGAIESVMRERAGRKWDSVRSSMVAQFSSQASPQAAQMTMEQASEFLTEVQRRAKGEIPSPVLEVLLSLNPDYRSNPAQEYVDGFKKTFASDGSGKAKGFSFHIDYPSSWSSEPGNRPNIVRLFKSENGRGPEMILVLIKTIPADAAQDMATSGFPENVSEADLRSFVPESATYLAGGPLTIDGSHGCWIEHALSSTRAGHTIAVRTRIYAVFEREKMIQVQASVSSDKGTASLQEHMKKFHGLFTLVANSLVLDEKWK